MPGREWFARKGNLSLAVAVGLAAVLRLAWVVIATRTAHDPYADPSEYLRLAHLFSQGHQPTFTGRQTDFFPIGYSLLLAPFVWVADHSHAISPAFMASLINVVAGTFTVAATGQVAARWVAPRLRNPAAWLMAICPAQIYFSSTAHAETVFTALFLVAFLLGTRMFDPRTDRAPSPGRLVVLGLFIGYLCLMRPQGVVLLLLPLLVIRARSGTWKGSVRPTLLALVGVVLVLAPWTIRNGVQVGVWTPEPTDNATVVCIGNRTGADGVFHEIPSVVNDCYRGSPFDDATIHVAPSWFHYTHPDEARWYHMAMGKGISWALHHPVQEVPLSARKLWITWSTDWDALPGARNYAQPLWPGRWHQPLAVLADVWLWAIEVLAVVGLVRSRACRAALPIWVLGTLQVVMIVGGIAAPHYRHTVIPLLLVYSAAGWAALVPSRRPPRPRRSPTEVAFTPADINY